MGEPKMVTEREAVLRERAAYIDALEGQVGIVVRTAEALQIRWRATQRYPLPTLTRPRVVRDANGGQWRCVDGRLQHQLPSGGGFGVSGVSAHWMVNQAQITLLADLLANPTETVEDDGTADAALSSQERR